MNTTTLFSSNRDDWETPDDLFSLLDNEFGFDFDAAASDDNTKIGPHFTEADDALTKPWTHPAVCADIWLNPPYSKTEEFLDKCVTEKSRDAGANIVTLIAARTDTRWWWNYVLRADEIRFLKGRLKFTVHGQALSSAPFPSALAIFRKEPYMRVASAMSTPYCWWWDWKSDVMHAAAAAA